ncbi:MAG TPA: energy transducer TonB [Terriglobales bacterium]|nr:energy transducer TonB [Terriglobales bacterium]
MCRRLFLIAIAAAIAQAAKVPGPSEFYVVAVSFSDCGPSFYYRVLEVKSDGPDSLIRYARIAPTNIFCPRLMVQAAEARLRNTSPTQLVKSNNPCAVIPADLDAAIKKYARADSVLDTVSVGIVAKCDSSSVTLGLPIPENVNLKHMKPTHPELVRLWDLTREVTNRVFGSKDIFHDRTEEDNQILQRAGEKLVPELASGRYDAGLAAAVKGNLGTWNGPSFRSLLADYRGPVSAAEARRSYVPELVNAQAYRFSRFVAPKYPPLAQQARIQGKVELQLKVVPATGEVQTASAVSGHPLLTPSAIDAARQWRFEPNSVTSETVNAAIDFALRCP